MPDYDEWINRERRIRLKTLKGSPVINETKTYRICQECSEVCLCHETNCPNCNGNNIIEQRIDNIETDVKNRVRCVYRFKHLKS